MANEKEASESEEEALSAHTTEAVDRFRQAVKDIAATLYDERAKTATALLCKVDVECAETQSLCQKHGVSCMPTLVVIKGGQQADKMEGAPLFFLCQP